MTLSDRLTASRELWMSRYLEAVADYQATRQQAVPEILLQLSDKGGPAAYRLYRIDLISGGAESPSLTDVNLDSVPEFAPEEYLTDAGLEVVMGPFHWNGAEFNVLPPLTNTDELADWCHRWIDAADANSRDEHGFQGAIHSVTCPELREGSTFFSVDFGTAGIEAVNSLFVLLRDMGASSVRVSSSWAQGS